MTKLEKFFIGFILLFAVAVIGLSYATRPTHNTSLGSGSLYIPVYVTTSTSVSATTTLYAFPGVLHTISITKPVSGSVITIYDSATTTLPTVAPLVITIPAANLAPFTLNIDGIFANGLTVQQGTATSTINVTYQQN